MRHAGAFFLGFLTWMNMTVLFRDPQRLQANVLFGLMSPVFLEYPVSAESRLGQMPGQCVRHRIRLLFWGSTPET